MTEEIRAAGGVVVRDGKVAVVHRPRYDDWSLPKGKLDPGEDFETAALREVWEETGLRCRLEDELPPARYEVRGRPKVVRWWRMAIVDDEGIDPDQEVDELKWMTFDEATAHLDYDHDRVLITAVRTKATYDTVAADYEAQLGDELDRKPLDRALLDAFVETVGDGRIADVGCGPGHITRYLAERHPDVAGYDISPAMIDLGRRRAPELTFEVGSLLDLPVRDGAWAGAIAFYSIIHLDDEQRPVAFAELARALRPEGRLLVSFHVETADHPPGAVDHLTELLGKPVDLDAHYLEPATVERELEAAGLHVTANLTREPLPGEFPSRRCYLLAQRHAT